MKKTDRKTTKLRTFALRRETIVQLTGDQLQQVAGGITVRAACSTYEEPPGG